MLDIGFGKLNNCLWVLILRLLCYFLKDVWSWMRVIVFNLSKLFKLKIINEKGLW